MNREILAQTMTDASVTLSAETTAAPVLVRPPYPGCRKMIEGDMRAWARLWDKEAANAPRLPWKSAFNLLFQQPGLRATTLYRISHAVWRKKIPMLPGMLQRLNLFLHGFDFPALIPVGPGLYVPHPVGVTVMAQRIGSNVTLVGSITIGMRNEPIFPILGDDVFVGAGARILGDITLEDGVKVGANAVVMTDVPAGAIAVGVPAIIKLPKIAPTAPQNSKEKAL